MIKHSFILFFILLASSNLMAQEVLTGLYANPLLVKRQKDSKVNLKSETLSMELPFFDDFTYSGPYPAASHWSDSAALVNSSIQYQPTNRGVMTLDALDKNGFLYPNASYVPFAADTVTSVDIRLDSIFDLQPFALKTSDSIFLSFYYQPGGLGNAPNSKDSLILEFFVDTTQVKVPVTELVPVDTIWKDEGGVLVIDYIIPAHFDTISWNTTFYENWDRIWASEGMSLDTFNTRYNTYCRQIILNISDSATYYRDDFRFRFRNIASLANAQLPSWQANTDQWNVDYIYLNYNRTEKDTFYTDISFVNPAPLFLKYYRNMPYSQYYNDPFSAMTDSVDMLMTNLDSIPEYSTYYYKMTDADGVDIPNGRYPSETALGENLPSFAKDGYVEAIEFRKPPVVNMFPLYHDGRDSATYYVKHFLEPSFKGEDGDSVILEQKFNNYFAYDDGIPEAGYGLTPSGAKMACFFDMAKSDTLRAVDIYFNRTRQNVNLQYFTLAVWNGNKIEVNGHDSLIVRDIIYTSDLIRPEEELANSFQRFYLDEPVVVGKNFFVGTIQTTDDNLNIGFDKSNPLERRTIFQIDNLRWYYSRYVGAVMIRPVVGKKLDGNEYAIPEKDDDFSFGPNPLSKRTPLLNLYFPESFSSSANCEVTLYSITGQQVLSARSDSKLNLSSLSQGVYLVKLINIDTQESWVKKLIITK